MSVNLGSLRNSIIACEGDENEMKLDFKTLLEEHSLVVFFFLEKIGDTSICLLNMSLPMCPVTKA